MMQKIANANAPRNSFLQLMQCYFLPDDADMDAADSPRVAKLRNIIKKHASVAAFARAYNLDVTYIRQLLGGHRNIGEKAARTLGEKIAHNPLLLEDHQINLLSEQESQLIESFRQLGECGRDEVAMFAKLKAKSEALQDKTVELPDITAPKERRAGYQ